jgi:hypothetical protein
VQVDRHERILQGLLRGDAQVTSYVAQFGRQACSVDLHPATAHVAEEALVRASLEAYSADLRGLTDQLEGLLQQVVQREPASTEDTALLSLDQMLEGRIAHIEMQLQRMALYTVPYGR